MFGIDYDTCTTIPKSNASCPLCGEVYKQTTDIDERKIVSAMVLPSSAASSSTASMSTTAVSSAAFRIILRGDQTEDVVLGSTVAGTGYRQATGWATVRFRAVENNCCACLLYFHLQFMHFILQTRSISLFAYLYHF